ncbi:MAG: MAPEG family protein, partial [Myxococcota bacterium]
MDLVVVVALLALLEYFTMGALVGRARARSGIAAPAITGDPVFERTMRAHQNTLEQLIVFLPALFAFAHYVQPTIAAGVGAL